jgi:hypothetical protein
MKITLWRLIAIIIAAVALWLMGGAQDQEEEEIPLLDDSPVEEAALPSTSEAPAVSDSAPEVTTGTDAGN